MLTQEYILLLREIVSCENLHSIISIIMIRNDTTDDTSNSGRKNCNFRFENWHQCLAPETTADAHLAWGHNGRLLQDAFRLVGTGCQRRKRDKTADFYGQIELAESGHSCCKECCHMREVSVRRKMIVYGSLSTTAIAPKRKSRSWRLGHTRCWGCAQGGQKFVSNSTRRYSKWGTFFVLLRIPWIKQQLYSECALH